MEFHASQYKHKLWAGRFQIKNQNISFKACFSAVILFYLFIIIIIIILFIFLTNNSL